MSSELSPEQIAEIDSIHVPPRLSVRFFQLCDGEAVEVQRAVEYRPGLKADAIEDVLWNDDGTQSTLQRARFEHPDNIRRYGRPKITPFVNAKCKAARGEDDEFGLFNSCNDTTFFKRLIKSYYYLRRTSLVPTTSDDLDSTELTI